MTQHELEELAWKILHEGGTEDDFKVRAVVYMDDWLTGIWEEQEEVYRNTPPHPADDPREYVGRSSR